MCFLHLLNWIIQTLIFSSNFYYCCLRIYCDFPTPPWYVWVLGVHFFAKEIIIDNFPMPHTGQHKARSLSHGGKPQPIRTSPTEHVGREESCLFNQHKLVPKCKNLLTFTQKQKVLTDTGEKLLGGLICPTGAWLVVLATIGVGEEGPS